MRCNALFYPLCGLLMSGIASVAAFEVDRTVPLACDGHFDTTNSGLYNLAFEWTKHRKLDNWEFADLSRDSKGRSCVRVRYGTQVSVHQLFEQILPSRILKTSVDKHLCSGANEMEETVLLSDIVLIDTLTINIHLEIDRETRTLRMRVHSDLNVPWFLGMFENSIVLELQQSLAEYHELLAGAACAEQLHSRRRKGGRSVSRSLV